MVNDELCKLVGTLHDSPIETGLSEKEKLIGKGTLLTSVMQNAPVSPNWDQYEKIVMKILDN